MVGDCESTATSVGSSDATWRAIKIIWGCDKSCPNQNSLRGLWRDVTTTVGTSSADASPLTLSVRRRNKTRGIWAPDGLSWEEKAPVGLSEWWSVEGETFLHNKNHCKSMPLYSSQIFLSIFGHTAVHSLPSAPAAGGINSEFSDSKNFYFTSPRRNEWEFTHCFKNPTDSNPPRRQFPGIQDETIRNNFAECRGPHSLLTS